MLSLRVSLQLARPHLLYLSAPLPHTLLLFHVFLDEIVCIFEGHYFAVHLAEIICYLVDLNFGFDCLSLALSDGDVGLVEQVHGSVDS